MNDAKPRGIGALRTLNRSTMIWAIGVALMGAACAPRGPPLSAEFFTQNCASSDRGFSEHCSGKRGVVSGIYYTETEFLATSNAYVGGRGILIRFKEPSEIQSLVKGQEIEVSGDFRIKDGGKSEILNARVERLLMSREAALADSAQRAVASKARKMAENSGTSAVPNAEAQEDVSCREFVIATAANACLNNIRSHFGEGAVGGDGPATRGECGLTSMLGGPTGDATSYAQTDDLAIAHSRDQPIDWDAVETRCEVGARMAVNDLCEQLNSSYNCAAGE